MSELELSMPNDEAHLNFVAAALRNWLPRSPRAVADDMVRRAERVGHRSAPLARAKLNDGLIIAAAELALEAVLSTYPPGNPWCQVARDQFLLATKLDAAGIK
jgi:hypothetical protein